MKILICEDEEILLTAIEFRLKKQGFEVVMAKDGGQASKILESNEIDLLVLDLILPVKSGKEVIRDLRKAKSKIPIIAITALEDDHAVLEILKEGANDFVIKPFKPFELILRIKRLLNYS